MVKFKRRYYRRCFVDSRELVRMKNRMVDQFLYEYSLFLSFFDEKKER